METRKRTELSRREFVCMGAGGLASALAARAASAAVRGHIPVGVQLFSVRRECAKDLPATLAALSKMGYQGVEFAGYHKRTALELRKMLDDTGLKCCGTHIELASIKSEKLAETIEFNKVLGNKFLIVPGLPGEMMKTRSGWQEATRIFNDAADRVKQHGMRVGYHNHGIEFKALEGELPWETVFNNARKEVVMQIDVGNAIAAGADLPAYIRKYPGRCATIHLKEYSKSNPKAAVGEGDVNWKQLFEALDKDGSTEWYIVEYEVANVPELEGVSLCLKNLRTMGV